MAVPSWRGAIRDYFTQTCIADADTPPVTRFRTASGSEVSARLYTSIWRPFGVSSSHRRPARHTVRGAPTWEEGCLASLGTLYDLDSLYGQ
eukprot:2903721-Pleurochrysis_carterae.AAC.1